MEKEKFYITTPIYYPSGNWHLGHCYTTVICDAISRFKRMQGKDVFFLTGTDEHGQKIEDKAKEQGKQPKEFIDGLVDNLKELWKIMDISYNKFIRTTDEEHIKAVQKIFKKLYEKGDIYKSQYEGLYCKPCESFWTETQAKDGKCPDCGRPVEKVKEESYFFKLSKYQDRLLKLFEENPEFLQPNSRVKEMVNNFLKPGLQDLSVSRTSFKWGIPVDFDDKHVVYVWLDALTNYITALGYGSDNEELFKKYWPADVHMMAKEIVRFHSIIWPAILMALDIELPKKVYGHGWLLIGGDKLSKSKQENVRNEVVDPFILVDRYGVDAIRYFLLREIPFGQDGIYTNETFLNRFNSDLANDLGNLLSRTTAMISQNFEGIIPEVDKKEEIDNELINMATSLYDKVSSYIDKLQMPNALDEIFKVVQRANKYIDETKPWVLAKEEGGKARLSTVLRNLSEVLRIVATVLMPFITKTPAKIFEALGIKEIPTEFKDMDKFYLINKGSVVTKGAPLFMRIDIKKENEELTKIATEIAKKNVKKEVKVEEKKEKELISIDEFDKVQLKVALVTACEKVEKADKLLKLTVKLGDETRTVVSGIAKNYTPEEMVGKKVVLVANLKPAKLRGIESQGMILCASDDKGNVILVRPEKDIEDGSEVF